jgi:hypothetical protein
MPVNKINRLISFGKNLNSDFVKHIENTKNVCLYKLGTHHIPKNIFFPNAQNLTLINCNRNGILNIFTPQVFPNLSSVNYLSADPGDFKIYERFNDKIKWVFPNKNYEFYDFMVKSGRGMKDSELIREYITNKKIIDGKNGFDISFEFDLNIPDYGIVNGEWWRSQFYEYLVKQDNINETQFYLYPGEKNINKINQETEEKRLEKDRVISELEMYLFDDMLDKN